MSSVHQHGQPPAHRRRERRAPHRSQPVVRHVLAWLPGRTRTSRRRPGHGRACRIVAGLAVTVLALVAGAATGAAAHAETEDHAMRSIVPAPVEVQPAQGRDYRISPQTRIYTEAGSAAARRVGTYLAGTLRPPTGYELPVGEARGSGTPRGIFLLLAGGEGRAGDAEYRLDVTGNAILIRAHEPAGLLAGVQTLRQLLPAAVESDTVEPGPWTVPGGHIVDYPRFRYRGAMLDVARHFFTVEQVKRYIEHIARYKLNHLHLHLTDDQGWRLAIDGWPRLTSHGGGSEVGGGPGGFYTKAEYREIVAYAQRRHITVVPEIDMPGHTTAALSSYPKLNCDGTAPDRYTGTHVGFSSLCVDKEVTYAFVDDVVGQVAALTPGPYIHIGGDEAKTLSEREYARFMNRAQRIVAGHGKRVMGWHQVTGAEPVPGRVAQYWGRTPEAPAVARAARNGTDVVLSPADRAYLDMKYTPETDLGTDWAGHTSVREAYDWNPGSHLDGIERASILGVEAPLWTETMTSMDEVERMAFPRLVAVAELGWSPSSALGWRDFRDRLAAQGPRWEAAGIDFYRAPGVPWPDRAG